MTEAALKLGHSVESASEMQLCAIAVCTVPASNAHMATGVVILPRRRLLWWQRTFLGGSADRMCGRCCCPRDVELVKLQRWSRSPLERVSRPLWLILRLRLRTQGLVVAAVVADARRGIAVRCRVCCGLSGSVGTGLTHALSMLLRFGWAWTLRW